jgi:regulator of replication initiation timing
MNTLLRHPLSAAFPSMSAEDQDALTEDIDANGQRDPITLIDGMVLDGWHRYQSCLMLEIAPAFVELVANTDPVLFVLSHNLHRRHLTASQRAAAVVSCSEWVVSGDKQPAEVGGETISPPQLTVAEMAKKADVSTRTIQQAKVAVAGGIGDKVRDGKLTVSQAAKVVNPPTAKPTVEPKPVVEMVTKESYDAMSTVLDAFIAEAEHVTAIFEADDALAASVKENSVLRAENEVLRSRINGLMIEKNESIAMVRSRDKQISKLEKEVATLKLEAVGL